MNTLFLDVPNGNLNKKGMPGIGMDTAPIEIIGDITFNVGRYVPQSELMNSNTK